VVSFSRKKLIHVRTFGSQKYSTNLYNKRARPTKKEPQPQEISYLEKERERMREREREKEWVRERGVGRQPYLRLG
jgi:hypothetical protein